MPVRRIKTFLSPHVFHNLPLHNLPHRVPRILHHRNPFLHLCKFVQLTRKYHLLEIEAVLVLQRQFDGLCELRGMCRRHGDVRNMRTRPSDGALCSGDADCRMGVEDVSSLFVAGLHGLQGLLVAHAVAFESEAAGFQDRFGYRSEAACGFEGLEPGRDFLPGLLPVEIIF